MFITNYLWNVCIWLSTGLNVLTGGNAYTSFSIGQHLRREQGKRSLANVIDALFFWDEDHCESSYLNRKIRIELQEALLRGDRFLHVELSDL